MARDRLEACIPFSRIKSKARQVGSSRRRPNMPSSKSTSTAAIYSKCHRLHIVAVAPPLISPWEEGRFGIGVLPIWSICGSFGIRVVDMWELDLYFVGSPSIQFFLLLYLKFHDELLSFDGQEWHARGRRAWVRIVARGGHTRGAGRKMPDGYGRRVRAWVSTYHARGARLPSCSERRAAEQLPMIPCGRRSSSMGQAAV